MQDDSKFEKSGSGQEFSCIDFDLMLSDAIDGRLSGANLAGFQHHVAACRTCGPIFADTQAGQNWLKVLEPAEASAHLVHNILAATSLQDAAAKAAVEQRANWRERLAQMLGTTLLPLYNTVRQPRFALNAAMAFFSISLLLNVAGLKLSGVRLSDLTPSAIKTNATLKYYETTSRVVKYYENIRFVYELESTVQELKRATTTNNQPEQNSAPKKKNDNTTQQPEKRNENYSRRDDGTLMAAGQQNFLIPGDYPSHESCPS